MKLSNASSSAWLIALMLLFGACSDIGDISAPEGPVPDEQIADSRGALAKLVCAGSTERLTVSCEAPDVSEALGSSRGPRAAIIGGQDLFVTLTSSNVAVAADTFAFDVAVTNRIPQPIGTTDGANVDAAGVRVFFASGPTSLGAGTVTVVNADSVGTFTASNQLFYQYNAVLAQDSTSPAKRWRMRFSPGVTDFEFTVYVSAALPYPDGYVDEVPFVLTLNPTEEWTLPGTVFDMVGREVPGAPVSWATSNSTIAAISGTKVTAGPARGFATLTATSPGRPAVHPTAVSVCAAPGVNNGTNLPASITSSDCFSSYGSSNGTPSTSFYADLYRVTLGVGQTLTVTLDTNDDLDTYLILARHRDGELVAINDDDPDGILGVGSRLIYTADEAGVYVIEASTFNSLDTGSYTLGVAIE